MEWLCGFLSSISRDLVCVVVKQFRYPCCFNNFVEELENEERNLITRRKGVKDRIAHAKKQTRRTAEDVHKWDEDADKYVDDVKKLLNEARTKQNCCFGHCPDWIFRYRSGKKLAKRKTELEKFIEEGRPYVLLDSRSEKYLSFGSRQKANEELMKAVIDDEVGTIGLYGMGGCGKTSMAMEVQKKAEAEHLFDKVLFVPVSSTVEFRRIQDKIARSLQYTFPENEERERAKRLNERLSQESKILVILDDVWQIFDFYEIGIPSPEHHKGCKVLITTRSEDVCNSMDCRKKIHLPILDDDEAWTLFGKEANINEDTSDTVKDMARQISDECKGLPVAIAAVASTLKGKDEVIWRDALYKLKSSNRVNIEKGLPDPYKCLELSYHYLDHEEAKSLFLLCSVFPEDYEIPTELLTRCAIGLGVVGEVHSYEDARVAVTVAKIKLVNSCLLLNASDGEDECVKMHDLVRDVAHWIAKNENKGIKCEVENDVTLEKNSVRYLWCKKLPNDLDCSNLEFLHVITGVEVLDESFTRMGKLRVLCLVKEGGDRVPLSTMSFKTLTNLRCLILSRWKLSDISFVRYMKKLESLSLNKCSIPSFLDSQKDDVVTQLTKLKLLVLHKCEMERNIYEVIGRIPKLEELCILDSHENTIEFFKSFSVPQTLQRYTIVFGSQRDLQRYKILFGSQWDYGPRDFLSPPERTLVLKCFDISNEAIMGLAKKAKILYVENIKGGAKNIIPNIFQLEGGGMPELNDLRIYDSKEIECLVDSSNHTSEVVGSLFSSLKILNLWECPKLRSLLTQGITPNPVRYTIFQNLQQVHIFECGELKYVFSANTVGGLPQLKTLEISQCYQLEQIVEDIIPSVANELEMIEENSSTPSAPLVNHSPGSFTLSKLTRLQLHSCPKLGSLFPASTAKTLISLEELEIGNCPGLKHLLTCERAHNNEKQNSVEDDHDLQSVISMFLNLKRLVLQECDLLQHIFPVFPVGGQKDDAVTQLTKLKLLVLNGCKMERNIFEVIGRIPQLEELCIVDRSKEWDDYSENTIEFYKTISVPQTLQRYTIVFGSWWCYGNFLSPLERTLALGCFDISNEAIMGLAKKVQSLGMGNIKGGAKNIIPNIFQLEGGGMPELNKLYIRDSKEIECLVDSSNHTSEVVGSLFSNLVQLRIDGMDDLRVLWHGCLPPRNLKILYLEDCPKLTSLFTQAITPNPMRYTIFQNLQEMDIINCGELKYVFSANTIGGLPQLKKLDIQHCNKLEQIVEDIIPSVANELEMIEENSSTPSAPLVNHSPGSFNLSKLTSVELRSCPKLDSLFPASTVKTLISLEELSIKDCHGLKHLLTCERDHNNKKQNSVEDDHDLQSVISMFLNLKRLVIERCDFLQHIFPVFPVGGQNNIEDNSFTLQHLKELEITRCAKLEVIFPMYVVRCLPELERLQIEDCKELKHIMEEEEDVEDKKLSNIVSPQPCFPKLTVVIVEQCHKLKHLFSMSVSNGLPNLEILIINGADELEELIGFEQREDEEIGKAKVELPKLKLSILMHLPNLCQEIELRVVKHRIINKCPKLSLTSTSTLQELLYVSIRDSDFANFGGLERKLLSWIDEIEESKKYLSFGSRQKAYEELMKAVKDDEVGMIGLYGMGGCGKTSMAMEVQKKAEAEHLFDKVLFVPVSSTVEVQRIQDKIASSLQYTFPENEERERAKRLNERLSQESKILVILDDVWQILDFYEIGIPSPEHHKGCKVLITTQSEDVCNSMDCRKKIHLPILDHDEAWTLFGKEANINEDTSDTVKYMARQISDECKGLPVAIAAVASTLKGKHEVIWRDALNKLKSSNRVNIEKGLPDPYKCLELSYHYLDHEEAKSLFLLCSVFPEDYEIPIELLTRCAIGLRVVGEVHSYEDARVAVTVAKIKLVNSCLLLNASDGEDECVKMHDLVRDVAHWIAKNENKGIKCEVENDVTLEKNSVRYLWCKKLPNDLDCSNLEFLCITTEVEVLDEIFTRMGKLRVLFLQNVGVDDWQPLSTMSFKTLTNLRCLILSGWKLSDISFVRYMKKLESLSLNECSLPSFLDLQKDDAVTRLTKLKLLVLNECEMNINIFEVIGRIPQLEELCIIDYNGKWGDYSENTIEFFKSFGVPQTLQRYTIKLGSLCCTESGTLSLSCFHISNEAIVHLAKKSKILFIANIKGGAKNIIPNIFQLEEGGGMHELHELEIWNSKEIECLVDTSNHTSEVIGTLFSKLLKLCIYEMDELRVLWHDGLPPGGTFTKLESLYLWDCPKLTSFFTQAITPNPVRYTIFQNLQQVQVIRCRELKYVFSANTVGGLPQLKMLEIWDCNKLEQIVEDTIPSVAVMNYPLAQHDRRQELDEIIPENTSTPSAPLVNHSPGSFILSELTSLVLVSCPKLGSLFPASSAKTLTSLEELSIKDCHGLKHLLTCEHKNKKQNSVEDDHDLQSVISMFLSLKRLVINGCDLLQHIFCVFFVRGQNDFEDNSCHFRQKNVQIGRQVSLVLETLELIYLPQMTCIWVASKNSFNLQHLKTLRIHGCAKLEVIFPLAVVKCLPELERLEIEECKELKHIMEENENDRIQRELKPCFPKLKKVVVGQCYKLKRLFSTCASNDLPNLEDLIIYEADELEELFGFEQGASKNSFTLQHLKTLKIKECAKLEVIFPLAVVRCLTELERLEIEECKELKHIMEEDENDRIQRELKPCFPKLKKGVVGQCYKLKRLFSTSASNDLPNLEDRIIYEADEQGASKNSFTLRHLKTLKIKKCAKLEVIFPLVVVRCLPELERLEIRECKELEQIMQSIKKLSNIVSPQPCFPKLKEVLVIRCHKLKHLFSTSASNDLPNLEGLIINGADELEELIRCEQIEDKEIGKAKAELPKLKLLILMHLSNLCQGIELRAVKHCIINNCPRLSLTSTTTLQELCENLPDSDFKNIGLPRWELQKWIPEINKSNEFSKRGGTSEFPSPQINEELEKKFIGEVHGSEVHATATSTNSELNGRSSLSSLDVCQHETHSQELVNGQSTSGSYLKDQQKQLGETESTIAIPQNIKKGAEEGTASENAMMVSSQLESTSSQPDSSQHKSYAREWDSKPQNTSPLQMNQEDPSTSKSKSPSSQVNDNNQSMPGSIAEMVHEHKQIQNEAPVSETISLPNMTELVDEKSSNEAGFPDLHALGETMNFEEIGKESIQEGSASEGAIVKTLSAGVESISLGSGVAIQSESSDEDILTQHSQLINQDDKLNKSKKRIQIQEKSNLMDKKEEVCMVSNNSIEVPPDTHSTRLGAYKHFVDLDDTQIAMLVEAIAAYPHLWNACEKFSARFQAWMLKTLADMLLFLRNESVVSVTPRRENEFHNLCDEAVQLGFERSWVDEMRQRVVARDPELDHAQARISELLKRRDHLTQEIRNIQNELKSLNDFVDAQTKCFDFL